MGINALLSHPFFLGAASSADTPYYLPVSLAGHDYLIDLRKYQRQTIQPIRPPQDNSREPGEQSLSQEGLWRRSQSSWHLGVGQEYFDDDEAHRTRSWRTKGLHVWDRKQLSLLPDTVQRRASVATNLEVFQVGTRLYIVEAGNVYFVTDPTLDWSGGNVTSSVIAAESVGVTVLSTTTDGARVWAALSDGHLHQTVAGANTSSHLSDGPLTLVGYANGRLIGANDGILYEVSRAGALTELHDHSNPDFTWEVIAPSPTAIYVGGTSADRSEIYSITTLDATGALSPPVLATTLPDGETIRSITYYGGAVLLGTSRGLRVALIGSNNSLNYGPVIEIRDGSGDLVGTNCFEGQGEFVWFGWNNYDGESTGLGRVNLAEFTAELVPAYASDLMADGHGVVSSVATVLGKRYFAVSGVGFYGEADVLVPEGSLETGRITYSTIEKKIATSVDVRHEPLPVGTSIQVEVETEENVEAVVGKSDVYLSLSPISLISVDIAKTEALRLKFLFKRDVPRTITDGETTSGLTTVTSATGDFSQADVNRPVSGAGIPVGATIRTVVSSTTVSLSSAATATATGVSLTIGTSVTGPVLRRWTLYSRITPVLSDEIIVPLVIADKVLSDSGEGLEIPYNPLEEFRFLQELAGNKGIQKYQEGTSTYNVYVSQVRVEPNDWNFDTSFFNGLIYVRLVTVGAL